MIPVQLYRKSSDGIDVALPTASDNLTRFFVGVSGGRLKDYDVASGTSSSLQGQLNSLGFELIGEAMLNEGCVDQAPSSDLLVLVNGSIDSRFREMVAEYVGSDPDWSFVETYDGVTVVGKRANGQTILGILGAAMQLGIRVAKPDSTIEDLDEVPIHRGGKEMLSFFGRDLLLGAHQGISVKAGLVAAPTVFTVGRSLVNF
ncbi:hypothetical protein [Paraburkholderia humisilvae]|uniref:Uncharacterized protein n=1 Tax=Paraburkholderia humisilvae TaxID=627669 RepID=A0A6J5EP14_9BURK|nr:hypothetical protein [Paraburkholderia humisilvae]CAB3767467.1 hypothetical protein LMG29542_05615 [Paraburkholderia humisilvae]